MWYKFSGKKDLNTILGDENLSNHISSLFPVNKFQSVMAYFYKSVPENNLRTLYENLIRLDKKKALNIQASANGVYLNGQKFNNFQDLNTVVQNKIDTIPDANKTYNFQNNFTQGIKVVKVNSPEEACYYAKGGSWCLGEPNSNEFYNHKRVHGSTFYFVFDNITDEPYLQKTVVDVNQTEITVYDAYDESMHGEEVEEYLEYLKNNGVDISQFKPDKYNQHEQELFNLASRKLSLNAYIALPYKLKSFYNQYGSAILSDEQFQFLIDHNATELIHKYVQSGRCLPESQIKLLNNSQLKTYQKYRDRNLKEVLEHYGYDETALTQHAFSHEDRDLIKYLIEKQMYDDEFNYHLAPQDYGRSFKDSDFFKYVRGLLHVV